MTNLYSIGDLIDKLIIENIKIFNIRQDMHTKSDLSDSSYVSLENNMNILNSNRSTIIKFLDDKISKVISNQEQNKFIKDIKTYHDK